MSGLVYLSNIAPGWSFERQEKLLDEKLPDWRNLGVYRDVMTVRQRRAHLTEMLAERESAFRPSTRRAATLIHVAALPVIAWGELDFRTVLTILETNNFRLMAHDVGMEIGPKFSEAHREAAVVEFLTRRRKMSEEASRIAGAKASATARSERARAGYERIKDRWELPADQWPTATLLGEAGISRNTMNTYYGKTREEAQRLYQARIKRDAKRKEAQKG